MIESCQSANLLYTEQCRRAGIHNVSLYLDLNKVNNPATKMAGPLPATSGSPIASETAQVPTISTTTASSTNNVSPFARKPLQRSESRSSFVGSSVLAGQHPHVYYYVIQLFNAAASSAQEPVGSARLAGAGEKAHPLSVSSSTGSGSGSGSGSNSDEEGEAKRRQQGAGTASDAESDKNPDQRVKSARAVSVSSAASATSTAPSNTDTTSSSASQFKALSQEEKDEVAKNVVDLLNEEKEEQVKFVLKDKLGSMGQVGIMLQLAICSATQESLKPY